jgi:hypothetical protein
MIKNRLIAISRKIDPQFEECQLTRIAREPIDLDQVFKQHRIYEQLLTELGVKVVSWLCLKTREIIERRNFKWTGVSSFIRFLTILRILESCRAGFVGLLRQSLVSLSIEPDLPDAVFVDEGALISSMKRTPEEKKSRASQKSCPHTDRYDILRIK